MGYDPPFVKCTETFNSNYCKILQQIITAVIAGMAWWDVSLKETTIADLKGMVTSFTYSHLFIILILTGLCYVLVVFVSDCIFCEQLELCIFD